MSEKKAGILTFFKPKDDEKHPIAVERPGGQITLLDRNGANKFLTGIYTKTIGLHPLEIAQALNDGKKIDLIKK